MLLSEKQLEGRKGVRKERQRKITDQYHEYWLKNTAKYCQYESTRCVRMIIYQWCSS
jgi:hypothetical protein